MPWMFQANPRRFDIAGALATGRPLRWELRQHHRDVTVGDGAVLWRSGPQRGVLGLGTVTSVAATAPITADWERPFILDPEDGGNGPVAEFVIGWSGFLPADELRADPVLRNLLVLRRPNSTVFRVSDEEWARLNDLC